METKTFKIELVAFNNAPAFKYWMEEKDEEAEVGLRFVGKLLVVDKNVYGIVENDETKNMNYLRGRFFKNWVTEKYGMAFYTLPTVRRDDINIFMITDLDGSIHNTWRSRMVQSWFEPKGQVDMTLKDMPYNVDQLMAEISEIRILANQTSKTNEATVEQLGTLEFFFDSAVNTYLKKW